VLATVSRRLGAHGASLASYSFLAALKALGRWKRSVRDVECRYVCLRKHWCGHGLNLMSRAQIESQSLIRKEKVRKVVQLPSLQFLPSRCHGTMNAL
jgi:hypothetical protein